MTEHFGDDLGVDVAGEEQGGTRVPQVVEARLGRSARSPNLGCGELRAECFACSNRAATRVNLLKRREMRQRRNTTICRYFAISRHLQQPIVLPSHGRGRWFEPSIAHSRKSCFAGITQNSRGVQYRIPNSCIPVVHQPSSLGAHRLRMAEVTSSSLVGSTSVSPTDERFHYSTPSLIGGGDLRSRH